MAQRSGQAGGIEAKGRWWIGRYYADVPGQDKRKRRPVKVGLRNQMTKPEARRKLRVILDELGVNTEAHLVKAINPVETFQQRFDWWKGNKLIYFKPSSCNMPCIILKHMIPVFGSLPVDAIDEKRVQEWVSALHKDGKLKPKSVQNVWKILRLVLGKKHTSGWTIVLPRNPKKQQRYLTPEEVEKIVDAAEGQYKALFKLHFAGGMRFGELAGLHVEDLDFTRSIVHIRRSTFRLIETEPKTDAGLRSVNVDPKAMAMVKEFLGDRQTGRIFQSRNGTPLVHSNVNRYVLKSICEKLGIPMATTHAFRHGRISVLQQNRVPGDLIREWVGHTSLKTTSEYTHFDDAYRRRIVSELAKT